MASAGTMNFFGGFYQALLVLYFTRSLGLNALFYGIMYAIASCSGLIGALTNTWITGKLTVNRVILLSAAGIGIGWLLIPLAAGPQAITLSLIALGALTFGISNTLFNINVQSLKQQITPTHLLGRVNASQLFVGVGTLPIGALLGGLAGEVLGLRVGLLIGGCGLSLGFLWMLLSPVRRSPLFLFLSPGSEWQQFFC